MISQNQIVRLIQAEEFRQLIDRILANGRCNSAIAKRVLRQVEVAAPAALGLAIQRLSELTYGASRFAEVLASRLALMQGTDGMFGGGAQAPPESRLAATAAALRGLITFASQPLSAGANVS